MCHTILFEVQIANCRPFAEVVVDVYEAFFDLDNVRTVHAAIAHSCLPTNLAGDRYDDPGGWSGFIFSHLSFYGPYYGTDELHRKGAFG